MHTTFNLHGALATSTPLSVSLTGSSWGDGSNWWERFAGLLVLRRVGRGGGIGATSSRSFPKRFMACPAVTVLLCGKALCPPGGRLNGALKTR